MKKTYTFVLAVFCGLFVFSFFGKYNHFANLLSSFYVQFVWLATVLGICLLVAKLYRHAAVAALILLLSVAKIAYAFLPAEVAVTGKQPLKIIQFNVNYANSKPQEIVKWINEKQPDVDIVVF